MEFSPSCLVLCEDSPRTKYKNRGRFGDFGTVPHWGQRKLMLSEIQFFTNYWNPQTHPTPLCVYAGAATGTHIPFLSDLFPTFTFHLYDPSPFSIQETDKIRIFTGQNGYFTTEIARQYKEGRKNIFFVSDIRTADWRQNYKDQCKAKGHDPSDFLLDEEHKSISRTSSQTTEQQVWNDMLMQQEWVMEMDPEHALLKFRLPWPVDATDQNVEYLKGTVYWQAWAPHTSTETRLKPIRNETTHLYEKMSWSILKYEEQCFHHNIVTRESSKFTNFLSSIDFPELLDDFDSMAEVWILYNYLATKTNFESSQLHIRALSHFLTRHLNRNNMRSHNVITLNILRCSPFKASGRNVSSRRKQWFEENPKKWLECQEHLRNF